MVLKVFQRLLAALFLAFFATGGSGLAWAQQGAIYTATGIDVDVTGDTATLRDQAMLQGQRLGLQKVLAEIAPADRVAALQLPSDDVISTWVQDFEIESEKSSATHYIGRYTFRFMAEPVQQFLAGNSVQFAQIQTTRLLVLPIYTDDAGNSTLWGPTNLWLGPWSSKAPNVSLVPMVLASGDVSDSSTLSATQALAGDLQRLTALAQRYGAGDVLVTELRASPVGADGQQSFAVSATRYAAREAPKTFNDTVAGDAATFDDLLSQSADRTIAWVQGQWKDANMVDASKQSTLTLDVPVTSLKQWVDIKRQLGGVPSLKTVKLVSLTRNLAVLDVTFLGDISQFQRSLAQQDLAIAMTVGTPNKGTLHQDVNADASIPQGALPMPSDPAVPNQPAVPQ